MDSGFFLSQVDDRPMYMQIIEQIKQRIILGDWSPGYKLPSIREFAVVLEVSVITVKRAYHELEREGVIVTQHGKGSFISADSSLDVKLKEKNMHHHLCEAIRIAEPLGLSLDVLKSRLEQLWHKKRL